MGLLLYCFQIGLIKKDIHYLLSECFRIKGNKISVFCVYAYRFCFNYCFDVICWAATNTAIRLNTVFFYSSSSVYGFSPSPQCSMISRGTSEAFCYFSFFLIRIVVRLYIFICVAIMRRHSWSFFSAPLNAQLMNLPQSSSFILRLNWSASGDDELR